MAKLSPRKPVAARKGKYKPLPKLTDKEVLALLKKQQNQINKKRR